MKLQLLYFARLRDDVGLAQETVDLAVDSVESLRLALMARGAPWAQALAARSSLRVARNQELCAWDEPLAAGDEVAFFPPVTGG